MTLAQLIAALADTQNHFFRVSAAEALRGFGSAAAPAVSALVGALAAPEELVRRTVIGTLEGLGPTAEAAVPSLINVLRHDESYFVRGDAAEALTAIGLVAASRP